MEIVFPANGDTATFGEIYPLSRYISAMGVIRPSAHFPVAPLISGSVCRNETTGSHLCQLRAAISMTAGCSCRGVELLKPRAGLCAYSG